MMGAMKGTGPRIHRLYPKAIPLWCSTYQLNRAIAQSSTEWPIRNMIGTVDSVSDYVGNNVDLIFVMTASSALK